MVFVTENEVMAKSRFFLWCCVVNLACVHCTLILAPFSTDRLYSKSHLKVSDMVHDECVTANVLCAKSHRTDMGISLQCDQFT